MSLGFALGPLGPRVVRCFLTPVMSPSTTSKLHEPKSWGKTVCCTVSDVFYRRRKWKVAATFRNTDLCHYWGEFRRDFYHCLRELNAKALPIASQIAQPFGV